MLKKAMIVAALAALMPAAAYAQPDDTTTTGEGTAGDGTTAPPDTAPVTAPTGSGPAIFKKGTMGLSFPVTSLLSISLAGGTSKTVPTVGALYFMDSNNALDLILGIDFHVTPDTTNPGPPPVTVAGSTTFGFALGAGYRMYKHHSARIHTFLEPFAKIEVADTSAFADVLKIDLGADLGAECMFTDWFSVSGTIGAQATFASKFKDIEVATVTAGLSANMYWD